MELAFEQKQRSCLHRMAHLSLAQEQTQELIIPDSMPDASRTLICYAEPEVQSKTNRESPLSNESKEGPAKRPVLLLAQNRRAACSC